MYSKPMDNAESLNSTPRLTMREDFDNVLENYQISAHAQQILSKTPLVLLLGPSSSGRNTVIEYLVKTGNYHFIVSDTTRPPRVNNGVLEQNGREYWFRTEREMLDELRRGEFLEAEVIHGQQVSGISIRELQRALDQGKIAINEVDILGFQTVHEAKPDTVLIMVLPPSFEEWQRRMAGRGKMSDVEFKRRMETAHKIFTDASQQQYATLIINDTVMHAAAQIDDAVKGLVNEELQQKAKLLAVDLAARTEALLKTL